MQMCKYYVEHNAEIEDLHEFQTFKRIDTQNVVFSPSVDCAHILYHNHITEIEWYKSNYARCQS